MLRNRITIPALGVLAILNIVLISKILQKPNRPESITYLPTAISIPQQYSPFSPPLPTTEPTFETEYKLQRLTNNNWETIYTFPNYNETNFITWKKSYIFVNNNQLLLHDTQTSTTTALFTLTNDYSIIGSLHIIDNTLYFAEGGYLVRGKLYAINLNDPSHSISSISEGRNQYIVKAYDRYWVVGGEGDACWGQRDYSLFDIKTKQVTFIATAENNCGNGTSFLGITNLNRFVISGYKSTELESDNSYPTGPAQYEYIDSIPLENPNNRIGLIAKQNMPKNIHSIELLSTDSLLLVGQKIYLAEAPEYKPNQILEIPFPTQEATIKKINSTYACLQVENKGKYTQVEINIKEKSYLEYWKNCLDIPERSYDEFYTQYEAIYENTDQIIKNLRPPEGYRLTTEQKKLN